MTLVKKLGAKQLINIFQKRRIFPIIENLIFNKSYKKPVRLLGISITNLYKKDSLNVNEL